MIHFNWVIQFNNNTIVDISECYLVDHFHEFTKNMKHHSTRKAKFDSFEHFSIVINVGALLNVSFFICLHFLNLLLYILPWLFKLFLAIIMKYNDDNDGENIFAILFTCKSIVCCNKKKIVDRIKIKLYTSKIMQLNSNNSTQFVLGTSSHRCIVVSASYLWIVREPTFRFLFPIRVSLPFYYNYTCLLSLLITNWNSQRRTHFHHFVSLCSVVENEQQKSESIYRQIFKQNC